MRTPSNKAASKGSCVHKALEVLSWKSYYKARGVEEFDEETFGKLRVDDITPDWATEKAYYHQKEIEPHVKWMDHASPRGAFQGDLAECKVWTRRCLESWNGLYDPANLDIVEAEQKFDFIINEDWAKFTYETPWGPEEGQLGIKGTMDLLVRDKHDPTILENIDFKTGRRIDWATGEEKTYKRLMNDPQLLLYYYACTRLYPDHPMILMTIIFINQGGPFRLTFGPEQKVAAEAMLRSYFEKIRDTVVPKPRYGDHCRFCWFSKNNFQDTGDTYCKHFTNAMRTDGLYQVMAEHGSKGVYSAYGSGGGRQNSNDGKDL